MKQSHLAWWAAITLVAAVGGFWIHFTRTPMTDLAEVGAAAHVNFRAPAFSRPTLEGSAITLADLSGQVVLVNFWATWCMPCRAEIPEIQAVYQAHRAQGFTVLAINAAEDADQVASFVRQFRIAFPILLDRDGSVLALYQVQGLPASFLIDRAGIVRVTHMGALSRAHLETELKPLLEAERSWLP